MSRDVARREVRRAVEEKWTRGAFAERARIDPGTLSDFLDGKRWAQAVNRTKIEKALDWPAGSINDMADGVPPAEAVGRVVDAPTFVPGGDRVERKTLSDYTLAELADEIRRRADAGP